MAYSHLDVHLRVCHLTGCNYGKGKWIADNRWPLYSGFGCKQWLSAMWACRLTQRTDFSYESFRWQPENCEMQAFDGSTFLKRHIFFTIFNSLFIYYCCCCHCRCCYHYFSKPLTHLLRVGIVSSTFSPY